MTIGEKNLFSIAFWTASLDTEEAIKSSKTIKYSCSVSKKKEVEKKKRVIQMKTVNIYVRLTSYKYSLMVETKGRD